MWSRLHSSPMGRNRFDVAVIGLGATGAATAYEAAQRRAKVIGFEQFSIPHSLGSHHGDSRMIRLAYYEHESYVPLLKRAHALWQELEQRSGRTLFHVTGAVFMGDPVAPPGDLVPGSLEAAATHGLPHERLSAAELKKRFPMFHVPSTYEAVFEPSAGIIRPEVAIEAMTDLALRSGAQFRAHEPVLRWTAEDGYVVIETSRDVYEASQLVVCGGAWAGSLMQELDLKLRVSRQVLGWFWPRHPEAFALDRFNVWGMDDPQVPGALLYGFPLLPGSGRPGVKIARHMAGSETTPDEVNRTPTQDDREEIEAIMREVFPGESGPILSLAICLYTNTSDSHFLIDAHPNHSNVHFAAGLSGHGFKFATVLGEVLADIALNGGTAHPIDFLRMGRRTLR